MKRPSQERILGVGCEGGREKGVRGKPGGGGRGQDTSGKGEARRRGERSGQAVIFRKS